MTFAADIDEDGNCPSCGQNMLPDRFPKTQFWMVVGGHVDLDDPTHFTDPTSDLDVHGPFASHEAARAVWKGRTGWTVDDATMRYFVVPVALPAA